MAAVESTAAFRSRASAIGVPTVEVDALGAQSLDTFAAFAFLVPYNSGGNDDAELKKALTDVLGNEPSTASMARYRRLQFESHTLVLSDTKSRVERTDESIPRKMPAPERAARHKDQVRRLVSVQITQDNEPSHMLLDLAQQMVEDGMIRYISLDKCTSRTLELQGIKTNAGMSKDASGVIRVVEKEAGPAADLTSDYKIRQAFLRRSLALDQAVLVGFHTHERWVNSLYGAMSRMPPPNYKHVSLDQILNADRELFVLLGEECREGVGLGANGVPLVESAMIGLMTDHRITCFLQPLPGSSSSSVPATSPAVRVQGLPSPPGFGKRSMRIAAAKARQAASPFPSTAPAAAKAKGKGKGKAKGNMPAALQGCVSSIDGKRICYSFNISTCTGAVAGQECVRGIHKCCGQGCGGLHSYAQCPLRLVAGA